MRETEDGPVVIEHNGVALPARAFVKDARVTQGDMVNNKALSVALQEIPRRQRERDAQMFATKRASHLASALI